jgi:hypothetical protein
MTSRPNSNLLPSPSAPSPPYRAKQSAQYSLDLPTNSTTHPLFLRHQLSDDRSSHRISHQRVHSSIQTLPRNSLTMKKAKSTVQTTILHVTRATLIRQSSLTP